MVQTAQQCALRSQANSPTSPQTAIGKLSIPVLKLVSDLRPVLNVPRQQADADREFDDLFNGRLVVTRYHYFLVDNQETEGLNKMLAQGWRPVRETVTWSGGDAEAGEKLLVLLERDDERPIFPAESLPGGVLLEEFRESALFSGCTDSEVREIVAACEVCRHMEGDVILSEEDDRTEMGLFIVLSGDVEVHLPNVDSVPTEETYIGNLGVGDLFGEVSFFGEVEHGGLVIAKSDAQTLCLRRDAFGHLLQAESVAAVRLVLNITRLLAQRLHETDHWTWTILRGEQDVRLANNWRKFRQGLRMPYDKPGGFFKVSSILE